MPELPEVETVLRTLENHISNAVIEDVKIYYAKTVEGDAAEFRERLKGQSFRTFERRGKYLLFGMDNVLLISHLRMEGRYRILNRGETRPKHTHVVFELTDGRDLCYIDSRKFGRMSLVDADIDRRSFHGLGPEPFSEEFSQEYIHRIVRSRRVPLKSLLLDQSFCAGIGNIYADEILAACGLRPGRSCQRITKADEQHIAEETRRILAESIRQGGTTVHSFSPEEGVTGLFQLSCMVHGKQTCGRCGADIKVRRIGGRSSYYCPACQK